MSLKRARKLKAPKERYIWLRGRNPLFISLSLPSHVDSRQTAIPCRRRPAADGSIRGFRVDQAAIRYLVAASRDHRLSVGGRPRPYTSHEVAHPEALS